MNNLHLKISACLLGLFVLLGIVFVSLMGFFAKEYLQEANQMLYGGIAKKMVKEVSPLVDGKVDTQEVKKIISSMMIINPGIEVYLLDTEGEIITYVAPKTKVKQESVDLNPVTSFLNAKKFTFIKGDDPRSPTEQKVFSAAPIKKDNKLQGYLYIILASEEQVSVLNYLINCYIPQIGIYWFMGALIIAAALGLFAIWYLTKNLRRYIETVSRFKEGDLKARVDANAKGDFPVLADTFNEMADKIVANIDDMKSVESLRRELFANVSHDLRTPLSIMQGYVETLLIKEDDISSDNRRKYLNVILKSSEKLSELIAQLFEYSKLEAKQIEPQKEPFQLMDLVQDAVVKYQVLAKEKSLSLQVTPREDLPIVFADVSLVERVIQNLIDNAIKYTQQGGIINISLNEHKGGVQIKVADNGPGISEEEQSYIFDRYHKINRTTFNKGTGLGLAIVKKILDLHNATIKVQSRLNEGTAFMFSLPTYASVQPG